jgi:hypothetical protein
MSLEIENTRLLAKDFVIFYCWQDHTEKKLHRFLIRDALNAAINKVQDEIPDEADCALRQDSDTQGRAGSVEIADTILTKINASTVIVADVTPTLLDSANDRFYPNPNVMLELGYGVRTLGWGRVICVFNETVCRPEQLPFDIRHRRLTSYTCKDISQKKRCA